MASSMNSTRRQFLKVGLIAVVAAPFLKLLGRTSWAADSGAMKDLPAGQAAVAETDPVAAAIGFHHDAKKTDFVKYPQRKKPDAKNQFCDNCALYVPNNKSWGKCQMLTNGLVSAKGWCGSYNKKPA